MLERDIGMLKPPQHLSSTSPHFQTQHRTSSPPKYPTHKTNPPTRYFGRARTLPGVAELFASKSTANASAKPLESRADLRKNVDASYYGYNQDEEDGSLLAYEAQREEEARAALLREAEKEGAGEVGWEPLPGDNGDGVRWRVPTVEEVGEELVERRRRRLLESLG